MELQVVGIQHAELTIREQVSFSDSKKLAFYQMMKEQGIMSGVILSTCNRSEVYALVEEKEIRVLETCYREFFQLDKDILCYSAVGETALHHLLRVVCGLESALVGEDQIFTQMKDAYAFACHAQMGNKQLHYLFQEAFHIAKQVRAKFKINEVPVSTSYACIKRLKEMVPLQNQTVLLSGSGNMIQEFLPYVYEACTCYMLVRSVERTREVLSQYPKLFLYPFSQREDLWTKADIIISATSSPHILFPCDPSLHQKEQWIVDLAVPRDIDPAWQKLSDVHYFDIDQIQNYLKQHETRRSELAWMAQEYIKEQVAPIMQEFHQLRIEPIMKVLHTKLLQASQDTYALLNENLQLSSHQQKVMKKTLDYAFQHHLASFRTLLETAGVEPSTLLAALYQKEEG